MISRIAQVTLVALVFSAAAMHAEEGKKCNSSPRECEQEIRRMLVGRRYLGLQIVELAHGGIVVKTVNLDGPAHNVGMKEGDRIIAVNGHDLTLAMAREFKQVIAEARATGTIFMIIQRRGAYRKVETRLEPYTKAQIDKIIEQHLLQFHSQPPATTPTQK